MPKQIPPRKSPRENRYDFVGAGKPQTDSGLANNMSTNQASKKTEMVRITFDLPKSDHRKLKMYVASEGITIANYIRNLLNERL